MGLGSYFNSAALTQLQTASPVDLV